MNTTQPAISILCPTRERPDGVKRLIESVCSTSNHPERIEILFYVDEDDLSFPLLGEYPCKIRYFQGPRVWISNAQNFLYMNSSGCILMTAADDMVFRSPGWDTQVIDFFDELPDKIALVFGNDLGTHAGNIATHGFFHKKWVDTLGTWVQPGRGSLWDLWTTENAKVLGRLQYMPEIVIEHVHYRQSSSQVIFDNTYKSVRTSNSSFRPEITYKKLERERRIDRILLAEQMQSKPKRETNYLIGSLLAETIFRNKSLEQRRRLESVSNFEVPGVFLSLLIQMIRRK